jgi:signal transduction histidine kinase
MVRTAFASAGLLTGFRRATRDVRLTVPVCILLICGSFAAAAALQMRLDRIHALDQAAASQQGRAGGIAFGIARTFARFSRMAEVFADGPQMFRSAELGRAEPAIRDIAVYGADGALEAHLDALKPAPALPRFTGARWASTDTLALRQPGRTVVVRFDPASLVADRDQTLVASRTRPNGIAAPVPGWPLWALIPMNEDAALKAWTGALPLYLFVILGPAAAGAWLSVLLVGTFQRQAQAQRAIKALKSTRPVEARLMVRLANAERGAIEALRAKSEFIAHMSHELRTPLNAIIGFSEVIAGGLYGPLGNAKYGEYANDITLAGRDLHDKIDDILEFANIEAGHYPLKEDAVDLAALVRACVEEQQNRAFSRRIALGVTAAEAGLVRADPGAARRIITNLLNNALNYTSENGFVRAEVRFEDGAGVIRLTDSGVGFGGTQAKAFVRYDRAGAGLGLAIAMELARRMGGAMRLASIPGGGASMDVRLPRL